MSRVTGICGECVVCGWGHSRDEYLAFGCDPSGIFDNRIIIDGKIYCPDCALRQELHFVAMTPMATPLKPEGH
jgi:hypothetical protein